MATQRELDEQRAELEAFLGPGVRVCRMGPTAWDTDPDQQRQQLAGEEDQSEPGWDFGP